MAGGDVTVAAGNENGKGADDANKAAAERDKAKKERLKQKAKNNKGCQQKKGTSKANRQKVNEKKGNNLPTCAICNKTARVSAGERISELQSQLPGTTGKARTELKDRIKRWERRKLRNRLEADHKYPSSKIKEEPGFKELEVANPSAARAIMHDQSNMRGLCRSCNGSLGAQSNFQGNKIREKIAQALEEAYK
ncbi:hypothetical protein [Methylosarcina fibrata]|uniref:hypothetical protein n=1 Tax=Methylosarcina fibrata TaxID=105972 RepID=UPI0012FABDAC|nr:hypothetical protein [Methylosarcina fibrata]